MNPTVVNPHGVLGVKLDATAAEVRSAYLSLVRQYPPDRNAEKFQEIHAAYQMLCDPLVQAKALLTRHLDRPVLSDTISAAEKTRPRITKLALLALGNEQ